MNDMYEEVHSVPTHHTSMHCFDIFSIKRDYWSFVIKSPLQVALKNTLDLDVGA